MVEVVRGLSRAAEHLCTYRGHILGKNAAMTQAGTSLRTQRNTIVGGSRKSDNGTSLRMQRIPDEHRKTAINEGNISACAEDTNCRSCSRPYAGDHICACRVTASMHVPRGLTIGTSLRAQRIRFLEGLGIRRGRKISAHAEDTSRNPPWRGICGEHLCACRGCLATA
jgi:hypothetical protein